MGIDILSYQKYCNLKFPLKKAEGEVVEPCAPKLPCPVRGLTTLTSLGLLE